MIEKLKSYYRKQLFHPTILSIFINPFYIIRKRLNQSIKILAGHMKGDFLDFGCGFMPYKTLFDVKSYKGIDVKSSGHDTNSMHEGVIFYDGENIPMDDSSVDSIFASEVFEHIFNLDSVLKELYRVLKPEGKLLVTVPFIWEEHEIPYDFARYTSFGFHHILQKNNFEVVKSLKSGSSIETCLQILASFFHSIFPQNTFFRLICTIVFISPINLVSILLNFLLPQRDELYLNNVVLLTKSQK